MPFEYISRASQGMETKPTPYGSNPKTGFLDTSIYSYTHPRVRFFFISLLRVYLSPSITDELETQNSAHWVIKKQEISEPSLGIRIYRPKWKIKPTEIALTWSLLLLLLLFLLYVIASLFYSTELRQYHILISSDQSRVVVTASSSILLLHARYRFDLSFCVNLIPRRTNTHRAPRTSATNIMTRFWFPEGRGT